MTGEKAQALGREFAERFFTGHQALICTHTDGHMGSGNMHVHIVINSLRKFDVERQLDLYNAARKFLKESFPDKVPTLAKLKAERDALIEAKKEKSDRYHSAKAAQKDLYTVRANVAKILDEPRAIVKSREVTL